MGRRSKAVTTPNATDTEEEGDLFTDGDFEDSDDDIFGDTINHTLVPVNETLNVVIRNSEADIDLTSSACDVRNNNVDINKMVGQNSCVNNGYETNSGDSSSELRHSSQEDFTPSIVGIIGQQHNHAEQRLAARRAARAEAREIRMRELERQQREQEDHADKAYDMYAETVGRRGPSRLTGPALHSPRRSSEDSAEDGFCLKDLRHELKEYEDKFRKAMILNAQLDNDKAALAYQLELLKDKIEELQQEHAQLQREHKDKCSAHERLRREHVSMERELCGAREAIVARDSAAAAAGRVFVQAEEVDTEAGEAGQYCPALALVTKESEMMLNEAGEGTLDVRLQNLLNSKQALESEVRKLKLQLNEERTARHNGVSHPDDESYENEVESLRKCISETKARAARAEAEAALQHAAVARLEAQLSRLRAATAQRDEEEESLKQDKRRLQREAREALNRVEELETENSHLTKRLDKLKNAKSALLKEL